MRANEKQVGGTYYQACSIQHWDLITRYNINYLEANATKYLTRNRSVEDLQKAEHYTEKIRELYLEKKYQPEGLIDEPVMKTFLGGYRITATRAKAIRALFSWENEEDLNEILELIKKLIHNDATSTLATQN